jgi:hypothetical protein
MGPECEFFLVKMIKEGIAMGKTPSEIGKELSPKIKKKFDVSISAENIRSRSRSVLNPRVGRQRPTQGSTPESTKVGPTGYTWCNTCKGNYQGAVCPGCVPDEIPAIEPRAIIPAPTGEFTIKERRQLEFLEDTIKREMGSFVAVGNALFTIKDRGLYREGYKTFEDYCQGKWGIGRQYANRLITGSQVVANLVPRGTMMHPCEIQPINEAQVRPLAVLEPDQQWEVWEEAVRSADSKVVTFKQVKALVEARIGPPVKKPRKTDPHPESDALHFAMVARNQLDRIRDDDPRREQALNEVMAWIAAKLHRG